MCRILYTYFMHIFRYLHIYISYIQILHIYTYFIHTHIQYISRPRFITLLLIFLACQDEPVKLRVSELTSSMIIVLILRLRRLVWNLFRTLGVGAELHCSTKKKAPYNFTESGRAAKWYCLETAQSNSHCQAALSAPLSAMECCMGMRKKFSLQMQDNLNIWVC